MPETASPRAGRRTLSLIGIVVALAALGALVWSLLPQPFDADLSRIGDGRPALVLVYEPNLVVSGEQAEALRAARETLAPRMHLLLANPGRPEAAAFIDRHDAAPGTLLLFDAEGALQQRLAPVTPPERLRALVD